MEALRIAAVCALLASCKSPERLDPCKDGCAPNPTCGHTAPDAGLQCLCPDGYVVGSYSEQCLPAVALAVNGAPVVLQGFLNENVAVDVPDGTLSLDVEATGTSPGAAVRIDGQETTRASFTYAAPLVRVEVVVSLVGPPRDLALLIRAGRRYQQRAVSGSHPFGSTALSANGTVLAGGAPVSLDRAGVVSLFDLRDGGLGESGNLSKADRDTGWTLSLSDDGTVIADSATSGEPLQISSGAGRYWQREPVAAVPGPGASAAMAGNGQMAWLALAATDAGVMGFAKDAGIWVPIHAISGDARSVAVTADSAIVAVSAPSNGLRVYSRSNDGYSLAQVLHTTPELGSSVALSGDGAVLVASDRSTSPPKAWVYERGDAGYEPRLEIHPAVNPAAEPSKRMETPVAVSKDGLTAVVGFPQDDSVLIASRLNGKWQVVEALLPAWQSDLSLWNGNGVSVSGDGSRVSVACPLCTSSLSVFERAAH